MTNHTNIFSRMISSALVAAASCLMLASVAPAASASHYRLPVDNLITQTESDALKKAGIETTLALIGAISSTSGREQVAMKSGLTFARLTTIAAQVDLLRVNGLGPSMVRLLQAGGIRHAHDLATAAPADLHGRLEAANGVHRIAPVLPSEVILADWIGQAKALKSVVEGLQ